MVKLDTVTSIKVLDLLKQILQFLFRELEVWVKLLKVDSQEIATVDLPATNIVTFLEAIWRAVFFHSLLKLFLESLRIRFPIIDDFLVILILVN